MTRLSKAAAPEKVIRPKGSQVEAIPLYDVSCSTMWGVARFRQLGEFFLTARRLGFSKFELNHQVTSGMLSEIPLGDYEFGSIHEPCPADISTQELKERDWLISSTDEACRRQGVEIIKRTIDLASELGIPAVVVHSGTVRVENSLENKLRALFPAQDGQSHEYQETKQSLIALRDDRIGPHLEAARKSLAELVQHSGRLGIRLGIENRYHYLDIPSLDEASVLLELAEPDRLGFVYDVGHAQSLDRLGFYPHEDWLRRYAPLMIGAHLHDAIGVTDHYAPGLGEVDFDMVAGYLPEEAFRTVEVQGTNSPRQVKAGLAFLAEHGCINGI